MNIPLRDQGHEHAEYLSSKGGGGGEKHFTEVNIAK